jgi:hypothetical protein
MHASFSELDRFSNYFFRSAHRLRSCEFGRAVTVTAICLGVCVDRRFGEFVEESDTDFFEYGKLVCLTY